MTDSDMKEIFNTWRKDVKTWMRPLTLSRYRSQRRRKLYDEAHDLEKKAFSAYKFQISGCKFLLHKLIELPLICSVEHPAAILNDLLDAFDQHKTTKEYRDAVQSSKKNQANQQRLSKQVWLAQCKYSEGRKLSTMV